VEDNTDVDTIMAPGLAANQVFKVAAMLPLIVKVTAFSCMAIYPLERHSG